MPQTRRSSPKSSTSPEPSEPVIGWRLWVGGDGSKEIPVTGLLADQPELASAELAPSEWEEHLSAYLRSPRT